MNIVVIDSGVGNINSIITMLKYIGANAHHANSTTDLFMADKLILPGVGAFDHAMQHLRNRNLVTVLNEVVLSHQKPILGICLGMQILLEGSDEGKLNGLGWIKGRNIRFDLTKVPENLRIPHMGWNVIKEKKAHILSTNQFSDNKFYFAHSYHALCEHEDAVISTACYGYEFPAIIGQGHIWGVQFHPEKSHKYGMQLLKNFIEFKPSC